MADDNQPKKTVHTEATNNVGSISGDGKVIGASIGELNAQEVHIHNERASLKALHQLRAPVADFQGREAEIEKLVQSLSRSGGRSASICGLRGLGGIGKTELAYAVADRLGQQYPDGQLLVELHGATKPITPEQALQTVIRAFEREAKLPEDVGQLHNLYISVLAGKRVLIFADDAKDAAQVRPLLPPAGCALLVTTRNRFHLPGMMPVDLGTLDAPEAEALLLSICPRIKEHAPKLAKLSGYLPLALRVSAGVLANSSQRIDRYLEKLEAERLKHLNDPDDPQASVEASLQLSYDALEPAAQEMLCQLSVFPTSFDQEAAVAVVKVENQDSSLLQRLLGAQGEASTVNILDTLLRRSLLEWDEASNRYNLHDLVREFGRARLVDADVVWLRYAQHYARVASEAQYNRYFKGDVVGGLRLFDRERLHIDAGWGWAMTRAGQENVDLLLLDYPHALHAIASLRYDSRRERLPRQEARLAASRRLSRRNHEGEALGNLGLAYHDLGEYRRAIEYHEEHRTIAREIGDKAGEGRALGNLGIAYDGLGEYQRAIEYHEQNLAIAREIGNRRSEGTTLGNLGLAYDGLGEYQRAIEYYEQNLAIAREIGDRAGEGRANWNLGLAVEKQGDLARAVVLVQAGVVIKREIGDPRAERDAAYLEKLRQRLAQSQEDPPH